MPCSASEELNPMAVAGPNQTDLSALRIDDSKRRPRSVGKWFGIFAAVLGIAVIAVGATIALRGTKPEVEVAAAIAPADVPMVNTVLNASGYITPRRRATVAA